MEKLTLFFTFSNFCLELFYVLYFLRQIFRRSDVWRLGFLRIAFGPSEKWIHFLQLENRCLQLLENVCFQGKVTTHSWRKDFSSSAAAYFYSPAARGRFSWDLKTSLPSFLPAVFLYFSLTIGKIKTLIDRFLRKSSLQLLVLCEFSPCN